MKAELEILKNAIIMLKEKAPEYDRFYNDILWGDLRQMFNVLLPKMTPDDIFDTYGDRIASWMGKETREPSFDECLFLFESDYYKLPNGDIYRRSRYFEKLLYYLRDLKIVYHLCDVS